MKKLRNITAIMAAGLMLTGCPKAQQNKITQPAHEVDITRGWVDKSKKCVASRQRVQRLLGNDPLNNGRLIKNQEIQERYTKEVVTYPECWKKEE